MSLVSFSFIQQPDYTVSFILAIGYNRTETDNRYLDCGVKIFLRLPKIFFNWTWLQGGNNTLLPLFLLYFKCLRVAGTVM